MITQDQPTCFGSDVLVNVSSKDDGTVLDRALGVHHPSIVSNRTRFCDACGVSYGDVVYQRIRYEDTQSYDTMIEVGENDTCKHIDEVPADGLFTREPGVGMLLPIADCVGTVVYDPAKHFLALLHLGRHSTFAGLQDRAIDYFVAQGSDPADLVIWMAPSVQKSHYPLTYFDHADDLGWQGFYDAGGGLYYLDMQGYNRARFIDKGVRPENITISPVNTATDEGYFSHSQGDTTGRFAVLAMMRPNAP